MAGMNIPSISGVVVAFIEHSHWVTLAPFILG